MKLHHLSIVTYAKPSQVTKIIQEKSSLIRFAEMAHHDRDTDKPPHTHVNLWLHNPRNPQDIRKWFKACTDYKDELANTLYEATHDTEGAHDYLIHKYQDGKFQYSDEIIKVLAGDLQQYLDSTTDEQEVRNRSQERARDREALREAQADDVEAQLQAIIDGTSHREMARRYGRDYIKNHRAYKEYALFVAVEETGEIPDHLLNDPLQKKINQMCNDSATVGSEHALLALSVAYKKVLRNLGMPDENIGHVQEEVTKYFKET